ncbi:MAG: hypothetical protein KTV72_03485, partial [Wolbachia endosymbiont of Melophagus ovinus]|nr:hypothetical protein [Wolbachia endosymbiont of Melophagus ovinus]
MPEESTRESPVTLTSYEKTGEDSDTTPKTPPQVAPRTTILEKNENEITQSTNPLNESDFEDEKEETSR